MLEERVARAVADRYVVAGELGRGAMSVVFLAEEIRYGRRVAIKVLSPELARALGSDRFLREIEIAARLNHPHIVPLLDSGAADGLLFYVMPHIDGESLRQRLDRETQLPIEDALAIARQSAGALAYAHAQGIVHRDIKPENILLTAGEAVIADFGIARALTRAGGSRLTESGIAVGTPSYMSPEQASGAVDVDERSDVYALGCVLYEMLAGEPPFTGPTAQAITARKLHDPAPDVGVVRDTVPSAVAHSVRRSLARVPADRYAGAAQFADALRRAEADLAHPPPAGRAHAPLRPWLAATALLTALAFGGGLWLQGSGGSTREPVWMMAQLPPGVSITRGPGYASSVALSPDGGTLVVAATDDHGQRIHRRPLASLATSPVPGTEGGTSPFFSPDGQWIGFFADGWLRRVPATGGAPIDIARVPEPSFGATWGPDGRIVLVWGARSPLYVVDAQGGTPEPLTSLEAGDFGHYRPQILPDGRTLLFDTGREVHALDLRSGRRAAVVDGISPHYLSTGHLVFSSGTTLFAAPFDPSGLRLAGSTAPVSEGIGGVDNILHYTISRSGTLAYMPAPESHSMVLLAEDGERIVAEERPSLMNPQFSPDGRQVAVAMGRVPGEPTEIWVHDLASGSASRLTSGGGRAPVWTPDGTTVTYSHLGDGQGIYARRADGRADAVRLVAIDDFHWLVDWTPDGSTLVFGQMEGVTVGTTSSSIQALSNGETRRLLGPGPIWGGRLSPDGRWLAYYRFEAGVFQVYVAPFPEGGAGWLISENGGRDPSWAPRGPEILYRTGDRLVAAVLDTTAGVRVRSRRVVLEPFTPPLYDDYDINPVDGSLVLIRPAGETHGRQVVVAVDWATAVRRLLR